MITNTFMRANSIRVAASTVQILLCNQSCTSGNQNTLKLILVTPKLGGMVKHRSIISLVSYCLMTAFGAALVFAIIVAGGSVALASHQSASAEELQEDAAALQQNSAELQNDSRTQQHSDQQDQAPADPQHSDLSSFSGLITDSYCGARHQRHSNLTPEDCARSCIRNGATYVLVNGQHRYNLSGNEESLNKLLGTRATVTGTLQGETISVSSAGPRL
jgi:hypothetical protein